MQTALVKNKWLWFSIIWASIILFFSVIPSIDLPSLSLWEPDKLGHAFVYIVLSWAVIMAIKKQLPDFSLLRRILWGTGLCLMYGLCIEIIQGLFLPTRSFEILDLVADGIGCLLGIMIVVIRRG